MDRPAGHIYVHKSPGELRAISCDAEGLATHTFSDRSFKPTHRARFGTIHGGRIRSFVEDLRGAFCELASGEEVFLRLKDRQGLTEGASLNVKIASEARNDKLARVTVSADAPSTITAFQAWQNDLNRFAALEIIEDRTPVDAVFDDSLSERATLPGGGHIFIETTKAMVAVDVDTAGRIQKGNAGARALSVNREAATEMARQISLRRLGGNVVMDCVSPLNGESSTKVRETARAAFARVGLSSAKVLKPSPFGLLEASVPWRYKPLADEHCEDPVETSLLEALRTVQREADANPTSFYNLALCSREWRYYLSHASQIDAELRAFFSGRVSVIESKREISEVQSR